MAADEIGDGGGDGEGSVAVDCEFGFSVSGLGGEVPASAEILDVIVWVMEEQVELMGEELMERKFAAEAQAGLNTGRSRGTYRFGPSVTAVHVLRNVSEML